MSYIKTYSETTKVYKTTKKYDWIITLNGSIIKYDKSSGMRIDNNSIRERDKNGFYYFDHFPDGENLERVFIDELVASLWLGKPKFDKFYVKHKDSNVINNFYENLIYISLEEAEQLNLPMRVRLRQKNRKEYVKKPTTFVPTRVIDDDVEEWNLCKNIFEISNFGNLRFFCDKKIINDFYFSRGFPFVNHNKKRLFIHIAVAKYIIKPSFKSMIVNHIDGDKTNHKFDNLRVICPNCHSQTETYRFKRGKGN
jgi:5-methylcytosine-specific restriction endonuclease McrA